LKYNYEVSRQLERELDKLRRKNNKQFEIILKKMSEILDNPQHYKPLHHDMKGLRRVHIDKSFVLIFEIVETKKK
jgi:YafQ family addiction module toxin component